MEREEKVREREKQKEEFLRVKLKRGIVVGKRGSTSTPPPTWRYGLVQTDGSLLGDFNFPSNTTTLSARKLASNLWEIQPHHKLLKMSQNELKLHHHRANSVELPSKLAAEPHEIPFEEGTNEGSLEKHTAESVKKDHHPDGRNGYNPEPSSLASYSSSMEMAPYDPAITPTSSERMKVRFGESSYSLKTSTELLKVLNRIWTLEEQHVSNTSLVKELKKEVDHSKTRIKELLQEKQRDQQEIDYLKKKMAQIRVSDRSKEQDQMKNVIRSVKNELEDEKKLRKHSESLHRRLARELAEINSSFSNALKELERERTARILLEELCDEFALEIIDYEQEVRFLRQKKKNDPVEREHNDKLILHLSEAWLDGRMQTKQAELCADLAEKKSVVEKLRCEIETFLQAKHTRIFRNDDLPYSKGPSRNNKHRRSLESFPLNEAISAPRRNEAHSTTCDFNDVELNGGSSVKQSNGPSKQLPECTSKSHIEEKVKPNLVKKKIPSIEVLKEADVSNMQTKTEECISANVAHNDSTREHVNSERAEARIENPAEVYSSQKMDINELKQEGSHEVKDKEIDKHLYQEGNLFRTKSLPGEGKQIPHEKIYVEDTFDPSKFTGPTSPVQKWTSTAAALDPEIPETTSKQPQSIKENTLRAKLLEARLESRSRTSKAFSQIDQGKG